MVQTTTFISYGTMTYCLNMYVMGIYRGGGGGEGGGVTSYPPQTLALP